MAAVTPVALLVSSITTGGTAVQITPALAGGINGGFITNPSTAADQGIMTPETLYLSPVITTPGSTDGSGYGTTFALLPGQTYTFTPGQTTSIWVNAATSGHQFGGIYY